MKQQISNLKSQRFGKILFFICVFEISFFIFSFASAATNIDSTYHYAWNDVLGWIDFYATGNVNVTSTQLSGYISSAVGFIALDCATSPNGNICGPSNFKVSNDGNGNLSGWGWNDSIGWVSFDSVSAGSAIPYQVTVNVATGNFSGWAWNNLAGWISFNCADTSCTASNYMVKTNWRTVPNSASLISSVFDTGAVNGAAFNNIMWNGNQPYGTAVQFQFASSNCGNGGTNPPACSTGAWNFIGPDGASATYYVPSAPGTPVKLNPAYHNNQRYFRYEVFLQTDSGQTVSPRVDDVIVNWSP